VLNDLANLDLNDRPVLGDRKNINKAAQIARQDSKEVPKTSGGSRKPSVPLAAAASLDIIEISDNSSRKASRDSQPARVARLNKAQQIERLTRTASDATDNNQLSNVVEEFYNLLESQRAKNLTKEGFAFLDTVHKQLANPSVFAAPLRESRTRSNNQSENNAPRHLKLDALARLKREVRLANSNSALAQHVADFGALINKSAGRTVTKDGMAFLQGLTARLRELAHP
jgi:casein kinase 1